MISIDEQLIECLRRYSTPTQQFDAMLKAVGQRSASARECVIPVLGMQGMGKSTLINGLLKTNILPNAADETTCVPVEVSYGVDEYGEVFFADKRPSVRIHTTEELNYYVDNNENPANKKGVESIKLYRNAEILKGGLTLVDLPGVGSITLENERTTKRYIQDVAMAIFMIPTVPTIRHMEEIFIQGAWSHFANAMFVQNDMDDDKQEIKDAVNRNTKILNLLASRIGSKFDGPIIVVNAFDAVKGALDHDQALLAKSNIAQLETRIHSISSNWMTNIRKSLSERTKSILEAVKTIAQNKLEQSKQSEEEQRARAQKEFDEFKQQAEAIIELASQTEGWLIGQEAKLNGEMRNLVDKTTGDIRAEIYHKIDKGIVDGKNLENAFNDVQTVCVQDLFDKVVERLHEFAIELQGRMKQLEQMLEVQNDLKYNNVTHSTKEAVRWEKGINIIGGAAGGALGVAYAGALAALILSNPAGWVIGLAGLAIAAVVSGIAGFFGHSIKKNRAKKAKEQINEPISTINEKLNRQLRTTVTDMMQQSRQLLAKIKDAQEEEVRNMRRQLRHPNTSADIEAAERDVKYLSDLLALR